MQITIAGRPGSGKTTLARHLARVFKLKHYSMGDMRGEIAKKMNITIDELNKIAEKERWTDEKVDKFQEKLGKTKDNIIIDGWISYHFLPKSIKIFLYIDENIAAERIFNDQRPDEPRKKTVSEVKKMLHERYEVSKNRYKRYYGIDIESIGNFDIVVDTSNLSIKKMQQIVEKLILMYKDKKKDKF